jgi:hypothetical protein
LPAFSDSSLICWIGMQCLSEWRDHKEEILSVEKRVTASPFTLSELETAALLEMLEGFAPYFPDGSFASILSGLAKLHGHLLLNLGDIQGAALVFEKAARRAHDSGQPQQYRYLKYFSELTAYRSAWKQLRLEEARQLFEKTLKIAERLPPGAFPRGFYWSLDDLKRDQLLLNATEKAAAGQAQEAMQCLAEWLGLSKDLEFASPFYTRVVIRKLTLEFLAANDKAQQNLLRIKLRQHLIHQDTSKTDLYCYQIVQLVWHRALQPERAVTSVARLIPRDAVVEETGREDVKGLATELEEERKDLRLIPPWIVTWLQDDRNLKHQEYARQAYACCIAEYYSAHFGLPEPSIFDGLDWAIGRLKLLGEHNVYRQKALEDLLYELQQQQAADEVFSLEKLKHSAGVLFPHVVRCRADLDGSVELQRLWAKEPLTLQFAKGEETWCAGLYYYLHPRLNFHPYDRIQRDPHESFYPVLARFYGEPNPNPVVLVVEGITEDGLFQRLFDRLYPAWRALNIQIHVGNGAGGTYFQVMETIAKQYPQADFFLVYDEDARKFMEKERAQWTVVQQIMRRSQHFVMTPDIEGVSPTALLTAIRKRWPSVTFSRDTVLPRLVSWIKSEGYRSNSRKDRTFPKVQELIKSTAKSEAANEMDKDRAWGEYLADAMLLEGLPGDVRAVAERVLRCARGLEMILF